MNAPTPLTLPSQPRTRGTGRLSTRLAGGRTRIGTLYQQGSFKILFPGTPGPALEAVTLNTSGGLTGGDRIGFEAEAGQGTALTLSTQAAERAYGSRDPEPARMRTSLTAREGAALHWLPQETILYQHCDLDRRLRVDLAEDAVFLGMETLVFGRRAMGERLTEARLADRWDIRRGGDRVFADALRLEGDVAARLADPFGARGAGAMATLVYAAPDAEAHLDALREALPAPSGVSLLREGLLAARLLAEDAYALRRLALPCLTRLARGPMPKVWRL
ncbi:urease accessory protein UreD [Histidinibacterium aquaticum]|uniref:Urease accessory protein UreD n=1 Tax=Histidinibacterium aquaticum TaxID=2613962 RepID=A0A5J5GJG1_9RHOB|nr:urease accessory protein UreD [Histidinibacterium aquaticum]KAA9008190.1 urease accessory protein UreD [Histidinibacterium aquaticum]